MNPITNSEVKERFRIKNEGKARNTEIQIRNRLNSDINQLHLKNKYRGTPFVIIGIVLGIIIASRGVGFFGFGIGFGIGLLVWGLANMSISNYNQRIEDKKRSLQIEAEQQIRDAYAQADQQTIREISEYDAEVKQYSQKVLSNRDSIKPMVDHVANMFQRMISHADSGPHMRFIETDLTYFVCSTGIIYSYQSTYTNPQDDYNFNKERYRDLKSDSECEGLAQALAKLVIAKMKTLYPVNSINITVDHMDARVTMHFKGANKNFVPARDIL